MAFVKSRYSHGMTDRMLRVRKYPLRKIVEVRLRPDMMNAQYEWLECGHWGKLLIGQDTDMFGTKSANSRRCRQCFEEGKTT